MKRVKIIIMCMFILLCGCGNEYEDEATTRENIIYPKGFGENDRTDIMEDVEEETMTGKAETVVDADNSTEIDNSVIKPRSDIIIALDPGHQGPSVDMSSKEPNAPGSLIMKTKASCGTTGKYTGVGEYDLNLTIAKKVRDELSGLGYNVIMTREDNNTAISNKERAQMANDNHADVSIRIHANGSEDSSTSGALVLVGSKDNPNVGHLYNDSYRLGEDILNSYCGSTGMQNLGIHTDDTMTGINWSEIPVIILEMGFMSNESDDRNMQDMAYQEKMVTGIVNGIDKYFGMDDEGKAIDDLGDLKSIIDSKTEELLQSNGSVAVCVENLNTDKIIELDNKSMVAASLIKLYIAGCIYELQEQDSDNTLGDVENLIKKMITASDNDATNTLIMKLGNGDASAGMEKVNSYCATHNFSDTSMGRLMLDFSSGEENYTSVKDTATFLHYVYNGEIPGNDKMLSYLKQQQRLNKIPAGIPDGIVIANKTGELDNVENDVAIVYCDSCPYIICVMTGDLQNTEQARNWIVDLSKEVYNYFAK